MSYRLAADVGGTFTDIVLLDEETGLYRTTKVLTTTGELEKGMLAGFDELVGKDYSHVSSIVHGTTSGLNSVIERRGAHCALVTTKGFKDVYEIARANRPEIYNIHYHKPEPLISRKDIFEVDERTTYDGCVEKEICREQLEDLIAELKGGKYNSIAVCLINSYANTHNEKVLARILKEELDEDVIVTASYQIAKESREYERVSTAVMNAYVAPSTRHHVVALSDALKQRGFQGTLYMMQSSGGVIRAQMAADKAVYTLMSGPVGGAIGAGAVSRENIIGFDIGGTSFDVSLVIHKRIETTVESEIEGFPILAPTVNVFSIGAGGGSLAWEEAGGMRVGPQSAGAVPGPVCYDRGGTAPTLTDANLVLGHLCANHFLGGRMDINVKKAKDAFEEYGQKFGMDLYEAAEGVCTIANHKMADAIRELTVKRGIDPRDFSILAFGGAGPMHAAQIAEELDIGEIIVPKNPGVFSAWGMLQADIRHDAGKTDVMLLQNLTEEQFQSNFSELEEELEDTLRSEQIADVPKKYVYTLDMRYYGQEYTISVDMQRPLFCRQEIERQFNALYERLYGHHSPDDVIEVVNYRLTVFVSTERPEKARKGEERQIRMLEKIPGVFANKTYETAVYERSSIAETEKIEGPAVIVELTSTTVVPPGWDLTVDEADNMVITKRKEG